MPFFSKKSTNLVQTSQSMIPLDQELESDQIVCENFLFILIRRFIFIFSKFWNFFDREIKNIEILKFFCLDFAAADRKFIAGDTGLVQKLI